MAQAQLDFVESSLDHDSALYNIYDRLYKGMVKANEVDSPPFPSSDDFIVTDGNGDPVFDASGNPVLDPAKSQQVLQMASDYSDILMKNSAYLFATAIVLGAGSQGSVDTRYILRAGDSMDGAFAAKNGFEAGTGGNKIFEVFTDASEKKWARVTGNLKVTEGAEIDGLLDLADGIAFGGNKTIWVNNGTLQIDSQDIKINGDIKVDGSFELGDVRIDAQGIYWDGGEFYHAGNSNKPDVDWTMKDANVYGDLSVQGDIGVMGALEALYGFSLGALGTPMLYSETDTLLDDGGNPYDIAWTTLNSDLKITNGNGIKFGSDYILSVRNSSVVSFSAPGMIMNLGDSDNGVATDKISLQSDIWDYSNTFKLVSKEGAGYFPNGLTAKCAVSGSSVLETFRIDDADLGVLFNKQIRFGSTSGPAIYQDDATGGLNILIPYVNGQAAGSPTEQLGYSAYFAQTTSPFRDLSLPWSATLHFNTDGEFFCFDKPAEAEYFAIKSENYKTRLIEDALFFDDGKFIEGVTDGLRYSGNGYFDGSISSPSFASGFAGYGWAVKADAVVGGYHATYDSLTVRKKMRVYEFEVQKISCTNGSLWVSDSCSGDEVIALN